MPKSPAFQFYPGDWLRNDVSGCSLEAQGLWLRMMMIMHDSQIYGQLILNNEPMSAEFIAKKIGISPKKYANLLKELDSAGVINRNEKGVIFSGRMERDEVKRQQNRLRQEKHREDSHVEDNADVTLEVTPLSRTLSRKSNAALHLPISFPISDLNLKRLIERAILENSDKNEKLVEVSVIQTLISRNGSKAKINSMKYFEPEIKKMEGTPETALEAIIEHRRKQLEEWRINQDSITF